MTQPFQPGDLLLLVDSKGRNYLRTLQPGKVESLREHKLEHDKIIGRQEGAVISRSARDYLAALRPTLADYLLKMRRGAQIIYPKDAAVVLMWADIFPGARVVEAGTGSGGLTLALLRAVGEKGEVISYEERTDFAQLARKNIERFLGPCPNLTIKEQDVCQGLKERDIDRLILDLPQPWLVAGYAADCLKEGGIFLSFSPQISQCQLTAEALVDTRRFLIKETLEVLVRPWIISGRINRPVHLMVGHTGFMTLARKINM